MPRKKLNFEQSLQRLEDIAYLLEKGDVGLDESLELYKEGITLSSFCRKSLDDARMQISTLQQSNDGAFSLKPFPEHFTPSK